MKTIFNRMRWLQTGILIGITLYAYIIEEEAKKKAKTDAEFNNIIKNQYKETPYA